jgi:hypothetical protein
MVPVRLCGNENGDVVVGAVSAVVGRGSTDVGAAATCGAETGASAAANCGGVATFGGGVVVGRAAALGDVGCVASIFGAITVAAGEFCAATDVGLGSASSIGAEGDVSGARADAVDVGGTGAVLGDDEASLPLGKG